MRLGFHAALCSVPSCAPWMCMSIIVVQYTCAMERCRARNSTLYRISISESNSVWPKSCGAFSRAEYVRWRNLVRIEMCVVCANIHKNLEQHILYFGEYLCGRHASATSVRVSNGALSIELTLLVVYVDQSKEPIDLVSMSCWQWRYSAKSAVIAFKSGIASMTLT